MATVVNRETLEVKFSVNTPDYDLAEWIVNPFIPPEPKRHWEQPIVGDTIALKDAAGIAVADANYTADQRRAHKDYLEEEFNAVLSSRYPDHRQRCIIQMMGDASDAGLTERRDYLEMLWVWVQAGIAILFAAHEAVDQFESFDAVTLNLEGWLANDPQISIRTAGAIDG